MTVLEQILEFVGSNPGRRARDIAAQLGLDRSTVNSALYGALRSRVTQDSSYRWWPKQVGAASSRVTPRRERPNGLLARLCRYYLDCLSHDDQGGLGVFASSSYGDLDYAQFHTMPQLSDTAEGILQDESLRQMMNRIRMNRNHLTPVLGYPVRLAHIRSRKGWEGFLVQPILVFRFEEESSGGSGAWGLAEEPPQVNFQAIRSLLGADRSASIAEEVVQLSEELGLTGPGLESPDVEDMIPRLRAVRPEWPWKESPDPLNLISAPAIAELAEPGIYNRAVLVAAERSPYTKGLETELAKLQSVDEASYETTALGAWLTGQIAESRAPDVQPLLEVLPLNSEQRHAVLRGLDNPLTVITGPPGTGKSQVVTSLLINAAWRGKTVLFASKNNKAVDVVETRINALGPRPILLRLGANELQSRLSDYLVSLLAASTSEDDERRYQECLVLHNKVQQRFRELDTGLTTTVGLRNQVDQSEQLVESIRSDVGDALFQSLRGFDENSARSAEEAFQAALCRADRSRQPFYLRAAWRFFGRARHARLEDSIRALRQVAAQVGIELPTEPPTDHTLDKWLSVSQEAEERITAAARVSEYFRSLEQLLASRAPEEIAHQHLELVEDLANISDLVWKSWLRLQPKRLAPSERRALSEYSSLLQLISAASGEGRRLGRGIFARYYRLFPRITKILCCWAVTSLSAGGRVPFEPGFFDIVVIDEASQCDIASALPLLFRSKQAVIIGDPKQLRHISSLSPDKDRQLLVNHDLADGGAAWAYSVKSLFELASSLCRSEDIIQLRDHHRSHADIIEFSNRHFYEGRLRVATRYEALKSPNDGEPPVRWVDVRGKAVRPSSGGIVNDEEAKAVVREIQRLVLQQSYVGSVGVVSPFRAQVNCIRDLISRSQSLQQRVASLNFLADTVHRFQGDERDIMIFSPTISLDTPSGALMFLRNNPNLFNVAITRARAVLVIIGDRQAALNSGVEYLAAFAKYAGGLGSPYGGGGQIVTAQGPEYPEVPYPDRVSEWERILYRALYAGGLKVMPQYDVEKYVLDFALLDNDRMLDIEVDGERYHRNWDGELCRRDQIRSQRLIELGWDVLRFWVYQVRDDLDGCVKRVQDWMMASKPGSRSGSW